MTDPIEQWREAVKEILAPSYFIVEDDGQRFNTKAQQAIATATGELLRALVGEDEMEFRNYPQKAVRNKFRAEIRKAAGELEARWLS